MKEKDRTAHGEGIVAYVALGSNLGDRVGAMRQAVQRMQAHPQINVQNASPIYESAAHTLDPGEEQPSYLNAVVEIRTTMAPVQLLTFLNELEREAGRTRRRAWAPRTLDLDLLVYGTEQCRGEALTLPHPRLAERRFVLQPLADVAPNLHVPPPFDRTVDALLLACPDTAPLAATGLHLIDAQDTGQANG